MLPTSPLIINYMGLSEVWEDEKRDVEYNATLNINWSTKKKEPVINKNRLIEIRDYTDGGSPSGQVSCRRFEPEDKTALKYRADSQLRPSVIIETSFSIMFCSHHMT